MSLPQPTPTRMSAGRIIGLVLLGTVALCGLVGSCLLVLSMVLTPLMLQQ